jgi:hypothetical protein
MKRTVLFACVLTVVTLLMLFSKPSVSQTYTIGAPSPAIGTSASFSAIIQFKLFDVLHPSGVVLDSCDIYPTASIGSSYTVVVQNSSQTVIASVSGVTTVTGGQLQRIPLNLTIPQGTGYRWGMSVNPGMTRNSTGAVYPYIVPGVMSITGNTFNPVYYYFFYNIRIKLPVLPTDVGIQVAFYDSTACSGDLPVHAVLTNHGPNFLSSVNINWTVNSIPQSPFVWTGSLAPNASQIVSLGNINLQKGNTYIITATTSMPNNLADPNPANDQHTFPIISVIPAPVATLSSPATNVVCLGESVPLAMTLTGSSPWNISLTSGAQNFQFNNISTPTFSDIFTPTQSGNFNFNYTISDANGCQFVSTTPILVNVVANPVVSAGPDTLICPGSTVVLTATGGSSYLWNNALPTVTITVAPSATTIYSVTGYESVNMCSGTANVTVSVDGPVLNLGPDRTECAPSLLLDAGSGYTSYLWHNGQSTQQTTIDTTGIGLGIVAASVQVTTAVLGCVLSDTVIIQFVDCTDISEHNRVSVFKVMPNPSSGSFQLEISGALSNHGDISLFNIIGELLFSEEIDPKGDILRKNFNFEHLPKGIYYLNFKTQGYNKTQKVIIH